MRFGDKLFFAMTAILTIIFTVFGSWMLSSYFQNLLDRVVDQTGTESRMYQYLFEMTYQTVEEYGSEYALNKAINNGYSIFNPNILNKYNPTKISMKVINTRINSAFKKEPKVPINSLKCLPNFFTHNLGK